MYKSQEDIDTNKQSHLNTGVYLCEHQLAAFSARIFWSTDSAVASDVKSHHVQRHSYGNDVKEVLVGVARSCQRVVQILV